MDFALLFLRFDASQLCVSGVEMDDDFQGELEDVEQDARDNSSGMPCTHPSCTH